MSSAREPMIKNPNGFHNKFYQGILISMIIFIILSLALVFLVLYQISHRPLPQFIARAPNGQTMTLTSFDEPNYLPDTLIRWSRKAVVAAYTFGFVTYKQQLEDARPYFTKGGWSDYQSSVSGLIQNISQGQLIVNGVVSGPPVISNQGELPGKGYVWRIQLPFIVTYQTSETTARRNFTVKLTIVKVPTQDDPTGIGIDQFVM